MISSRVDRGEDSFDVQVLAVRMAAGELGRIVIRGGWCDLDMILVVSNKAVAEMVSEKGNNI